jgi:hypothetical protein
MAKASNEGIQMTRKNDEKQSLSAKERRAVLKKLGRFAAVSAPAVTLLLSAQSKPASAQPISSCAVDVRTRPSDTKPA